MQNILKNDTYNKIKILHKLSQLDWFIQKHALEDAQEANDTKAVELLQALCKDLESHIHEFERLATKK